MFPFQRDEAAPSDLPVELSFVFQQRVSSRHCSPVNAKLTSQFTSCRQTISRVEGTIPDQSPNVLRQLPINGRGGTMIESRIGGVPESSGHAAQLASDALKTLLEKMRGND